MTPLQAVLKKYPPEQHGGCFLATDYLLTLMPGLKREVATIYPPGKQPMRHCYAVTQQDNIIDTQVWQFGLVMPLPDSALNRHVFTREEHEALLPRRP